MNIAKIIFDDLSYICSNHLIGFIVFLFTNFLSWFLLRLLTDHKFLWCKHNCSKCGCWTCKFYHVDN